MAFSQLLPAVAYLVQSADGNGGRLFLKREKGAIPLLWLLAYLPFVLSRYVNVVVVRLAIGEPPATDLGHGILVGGRVMPWERALLAEHRVSAVLDVCAELPRDPGMAARRLSYKAVPVLDASGPTVDQLADGVEWCRGHLERGGTVLVQCTLGHGRSATFVAALLLVTGRSHTIEEAVSLMRAKRNRVGLNRQQRGSLEKALAADVIAVAPSAAVEDL